MKPTKSNIWCFKQNKPSLVVDDITNQYNNVQPTFVYEVLLKRGVFKWLSVRRNLITLKDKWREHITSLMIAIRREKGNIEISFLNKQQPNYGKLEHLRGYLKGYEECRKDIRKLCHSDRWVAPDFDKKANNYLKEIEK